MKVTKDSFNPMSKRKQDSPFLYFWREKLCINIPTWRRKWNSAPSDSQKWQFFKLSQDQILSSINEDIQTHDLLSYISRKYN